MKCFVVLATLVAASLAQYQGLPVHKTITPVRNPSVSAVLTPGNPAIGLRSNLPVATRVYSPVVRKTYVKTSPILKTIVRPVVKTIPQPIVKAVVKPIEPVVAQPIVRTIAQPIAQPIVKTVAQPIVPNPIIKAVPAVPEPIVKAVPAVVESAAVPAVPVEVPGATSSQFHAQDEFGNYNYGYQNQNSAKQESGNVATGVQGSYAYVDGHGIQQQVNYVADALGFRASGTNIPVPARYRRQVQPALDIVQAPIQRAAVPLNYNAQPVQEAVLTTIQNNPGHAWSYRVD